jgi:hypothetical protein
MAVDPDLAVSRVVNTLSKEAGMQSAGALIMFFLIGAMAAVPSGTWLPAAGMPAAKHAKAVATGTWGGEHIILEVSEKGAEVEFDCAHGHISQAMTLNQQGAFDVQGTFAQEHGGPVLRDEPENSKPARYSGHVVGDTMTLTLTQEKEKIGTFTLTRGAQPMLRKCR